MALLFYKRKKYRIGIYLIFIELCHKKDTALSGFEQQASTYESSTANLRSGS
jgi:hypothetical protein